MRFSINEERGEMEKQEQLFNILREISDPLQRVMLPSTHRTLTQCDSSLPSAQSPPYSPDSVLFPGDELEEVGHKDC